MADYHSEFDIEMRMRVMEENLARLFTLLEGSVDSEGNSSPGLVRRMEHLETLAGRSLIALYGIGGAIGTIAVSLATIAARAALHLPVGP